MSAADAGVGCAAAAAAAAAGGAVATGTAAAAAAAVYETRCRYYIVFMCHFSCLSAHAHEHVHEPQTELHHTTHELTLQTGCSSRDTGFMPLADAGGLETCVPREHSLRCLVLECFGTGHWA